MENEKPRKFEIVSTGRVLGEKKQNPNKRDSKKPIHEGIIVYNGSDNQDAVIKAFEHKETNALREPTGEPAVKEVEVTYPINPKSISIIGDDYAWMYHVKGREKEMCKYIPSSSFKENVRGVYKYKPNSKVLFQFKDKEKTIVNVIGHG